MQNRTPQSGGPTRSPACATRLWCRVGASSQGSPLPAAPACACMRPRWRLPLPFHCMAFAVFQTVLAVLAHHPAAPPRHPLLASRWPPPKFEFAAAARPQQPLVHAPASACTFPRLSAMTAQGGGAVPPPADARLRALYSVMQSIEVRRCGPTALVLGAAAGPLLAACPSPAGACPL